MSDAAAPVEPGLAADNFLSLRDISKIYAGKRVVNNVSLSVARGEVLTILGPSGCGKTTTLKMIAGFLSPDAGTMSIDGQNVNAQSSHQRGAAMVFQNYALFPHMTVRRNIAFGLRMRRLPAAQIAHEVEKMLARVRLEQFAERYPRELSGGQQQRVALARALIIKPKILLLDEPFSSLDAKLRKQLRSEFLEVHRAFGITSVFVTHDLEEAFAISDKVAVMNDGRLEQIGPQAEIFACPQSRFVADFVGHKNLLAGEVRQMEGAQGRQFATGPLAMRMPDSAPLGPALVTVPVHRIRITRGEPEGDNSFSVRVASVSFLGPAMEIGIDIQGVRFEVYAPSSAVLAGLKVGDSVVASWDAGDITLIPSGRV